MASAALGGDAAVTVRDENGVVEVQVLPACAWSALSSDLGLASDLELAGKQVILPNGLQGSLLQHKSFSHVVMHSLTHGH